MSAPVPVPTEIKYAVVNDSDSIVVNIISWDGSYGWVAPEGTSVVEILTGEECEINYTFDQFGAPRFQLVGESYLNSIFSPDFDTNGSLRIGLESPSKGYGLIFPDGTSQSTAIFKDSINYFTALQEFSAGICGQVYAIDPVDGTGIIVAKGLAGSDTRIGAIRLGYANTVDNYNTLLHNSSGTFTIFNGFSPTGSNLLNISSSVMNVNVPVSGMNFTTGITAPNVVYSVNGCTGYIGITGTENEVQVTKSCPNITVGLPDEVIITGSLNVVGSIYIDGGTF
jgi:hypothetical protein